MFLLCRFRFVSILYRILHTGTPASCCHCKLLISTEVTNCKQCFFQIIDWRSLEMQWLKILCIRFGILWINLINKLYLVFNLQCQMSNVLWSFQISFYLKKKEGYNENGIKQCHVKNAFFSLFLSMFFFLLTFTFLFICVFTRECWRVIDWEPLWIHVWSFEGYFATLPITLSQVLASSKTEAGDCADVSSARP